AEGPHSGSTPVHLLPRLEKVAADLARTQWRRQARIAMGQDERTDARRAWQLEHPGFRCQRDAVLPVEVAIADDRHVGCLANARDAAVRVAAAQVVTQERQPSCAGRAERSERLLERRGVAVYVGNQA